MRRLLVIREQIGSTIETAFRRWLSKTDRWDLLEAAIHQRVGVTLYWSVESGDGGLNEVEAGIILTYGSPHEPDEADHYIPGFVGYLPHVPLIRRAHRESDITQILREWNAKLPFEVVDPWRTRLDRFEDFLLATPELIPWARASLDARFTADVYDEFVALGEAWIDSELARLEQRLG